MNPGEFLVLGFEEIREDYRTPEFVKKYEGEGKKVELEGARSVVLKLMTEERYEGQFDLQLAFPKQFCFRQSCRMAKFFCKHAICAKEMRGGLVIRRSPARKSIRLRSNQALAPDAA
jgi:hypothetical protein